MASPLPPWSLLSLSPFCSSSSSLRRTFLSPAAGDLCAGPRQRELRSNSSPCGRRIRRGGSLRRATFDDSAVLDPPLALGELGPYVASLKLKLLSAVSGLNRGLAANEEDLRIADSAAKELEAAGGVVDLTKELDKLQGKWKLIYSSAFSSRTLGGNRPGPPTGRLIPVTLGQVFQRIDVVSKDFDNIVELQFATPWPVPPIEATVSLAHKFELIGSVNMKITFEKSTVKPTGNLAQLPPLEVPRLPDALRLSNTGSGEFEVPRLPDALRLSNTGSGEFEVTFLDSDFRITRGDRGELRVFVSS